MIINIKPKSLIIVNIKSKSLMIINVKSKSLIIINIKPKSLVIINIKLIHNFHYYFKGFQNLPLSVNIVQSFENVQITILFIISTN